MLTCMMCYDVVVCPPAGEGQRQSTSSEFVNPYFWIFGFSKTSRTSMVAASMGQSSAKVIQQNTAQHTCFQFNQSPHPHKLSRAAILSSTMVRWGPAEDLLLRQHIHSGLINPQNLDPIYLFQVTQDHFPAFIGEGASSRSTAIQCLCRKFCQTLEERHLQGARRGQRANQEQ